MYLRYFSYIFRHRWYVFLECIRERIIWKGITHDLSKFLPSEFIPYAKYFYGPDTHNRRDETGYYKPTDTGDLKFDFAWLLHQKRNRHHWQWWLMVDPSLCKCYNTNENNKTNLCLKKYADNAGLSVLKKIFFMADRLENFAKSILLKRQNNINLNTLNNLENTIEKDIGKTQIILEKKLKKKQGNIAKVALIIMVENLLRVLVVVKRKMSFCVLTTLKEVETNIDIKLKNKDLLSTDGLLKINSQKDSESSAITAIAHTPIMGFVPIRKTMFLAQDEGGIKCFSCGKEILPEDEGGIKILEMTGIARKEMLCDWRGAGKAQGFDNNTKDWYAKNYYKLKLHPDTRKWFDMRILG